MSFFRGIKRALNEGKEDDALRKDAASRPPTFNTACKFSDFGFASVALPFYSPVAWSPFPSTFKVCQGCFIASLAPLPFGKYWTRDFRRARDPDELVHCSLSDKLNEPAWKEAVRQGKPEPLLERIKVMEGMRNALKGCPTVENKLNEKGEVGMRVLKWSKEVEDGKESFHVCEYHFKATIKDGLWKDSFVEILPPENKGMVCDYGPSEWHASIAAIMARRQESIQVFEEWCLAYKTVKACNGVIEKWAKRYTLPEVTYSTSDEFQLCENCYCKIVKPHDVVTAHFKEDEAIVRGSCSANSGTTWSITAKLLESTWKETPQPLLELAKTVAPVPKCPGFESDVQMRVWWKSDDLSDYRVCEYCFKKTVLPSTLYTSFRRCAGPSEKGRCIMAIPQIPALYVAACQTGKIAEFKTSTEQLLAQINKEAAEKGSDTAAKVALGLAVGVAALALASAATKGSSHQHQQHQVQQAQTQNQYHPEADLSKVRGTPEQLREIAELRDAIVALDAKADHLMKLAQTETSGGFSLSVSGASVYDPTGRSGFQRVSDGHGNWFNTESEARGSSMSIEGGIKMNQAFQMKREVIMMRGRMEEMKKKLTPV